MYQHIVLHMLAEDQKAIWMGRRFNFGSWMILSLFSRIVTGGENCFVYDLQSKRALVTRKLPLLHAEIPKQNRSKGKIMLELFFGI